MEIKLVLYVVMILTVCVMIWANMQYKTKGVPWGRPLAGLCGVVALLLAVSAMLVHVIEPSIGQGQLREKEQKYQYIAYKMMGAKIAKQHPGADILLVRYSTGQAEAAVSMSQAQMDGLKEGLGAKANIVRTEELSSGMEMEMGEGDMPAGPMMDPGAMLTAEKFDQIMDDNSDCNLILSLVGLPYDMKSMKYWQKAQEGEEVPKLALVNAHIYELKPAIKAGLISVVLQNKPEVYDWKAPVPDDEEAAFNNRFLIITPENVDEVAAKYPQLFMEEKK